MSKVTMVAQLAAAHFKAEPAQVEQLAHELYASQGAARNADGTYLKVLVAACQASLGKAPRRKATDVPGQLAVLEKVNETFYAAVLRGVTTPDVQPDPSFDKAESTRRSLERNRRSTFARSAKSTLAAFVGAGGDMRKLDVVLTTKALLRGFVDQGRDTELRHNLTIERAERAILAVLEEEEPDAARDRLETLIERLQETLAHLPANDAVAEPLKKAA